ncbi:MAG: ABC transporter permease, partial [Acidobacteria bacterium]|nr:ABC transporter permease [Acidobacteriota bacterium]
MGRPLVAADEVVGAPEVVVLGHDLWLSRLGGDPEVLGRSLEIAGVPHTVVGVMPEGFLFPIRQQLWLPLREARPAEPGRGRGLHIFGRLAAGVSAEAAHWELTAVGSRLAEEHPETNAQLEPQAVPFSLSYLNLARGGLRQEPGFRLFQLLGFCLL